MMSDPTSEAIAKASLSGEARTYEGDELRDIKVVRAARAAKEVTKGKGKRSRKRKSAALEAEGQDLESGLPCIAQDADEAEPEASRMIEGQRAPVAYMG